MIYEFEQLTDVDLVIRFDQFSAIIKPQKILSINLANNGFLGKENSLIIRMMGGDIHHISDSSREHSGDLLEFYNTLLKIWKAHCRHESTYIGGEGFATTSLLADGETLSIGWGGSRIYVPIENILGMEISEKVLAIHLGDRTVKIGIADSSSIEKLTNLKSAIEVYRKSYVG